MGQNTFSNFSTFTLTIVDVNDHGPVFTNFDKGTGYIATVTENVTTGFVLRTISVSDGDAGILPC